MMEFKKAIRTAFRLLVLAGALIVTTADVHAAIWAQKGADIDGETAGDTSGWSVSLSSDGNTMAVGAPDNDGTGTGAGHVRVFQLDTGTGAWAQKGADMDGEAAADRSGWSVSLSADGNTVAVGAHTNDGNGSDAGHVRVFQYDAGTGLWTRKGADINGEAAGDNSGYSVSLSADGNTVAVGALYNDENGADSGHVRVFQYDAGTWAQKGADIDGEAASDKSGNAVSLSADGAVVAVGAFWNGGNGFWAGHVRVFQYDAGAWAQVGADIDGETAGDWAGYSVSLSADGTRLAVGAPRNDGNGADAGHVRVFQWGSGAWPQVGADIDGEAAGDFSGNTVSLSADGNTLAVTAPQNGGAGTAAGQVRLFQYASGAWTQIGADIDGEAAGDQSGYSAALSADGTRVAAGAAYNDGSGSDAGQVRVYDLAAEWTQTGGDIDGEAAEDQLGRSVSLSTDGNTMAVGAPYNDDTGSVAGHVRVFEYDAGAWAQKGGDIDGEAAGDESGWSLSLSADGNIVAVGAARNDGSGVDAGHVRVFQYASGAWTQVGADIDGETAGDRSGWSVSLSADGTVLAVGANKNDGSGVDAGHVRVFQYASGAWTQVGADIDGEAAGDESGWSVSLSADGTRVAVGTLYNAGNGSDAGHVRVFQYNAGSWTQVGADIDGEAAGDYAGYSVSLSADGTRVAMGAPRNNGNGSRAGHVRVFEYGAGAWTQVGADMDGEAADDFSGWSVSLSDDGTRVAAGAYGNDANGSDAGQVRVYQYDAGAWTQVGADMDGEAAGDWYGASVSLSGDGGRVAAGAILNDGIGAEAGHVRVYGVDLTPVVFTQAVSGIGQAAALGSGNIDSLGVPNPTAHGLCWNTGGNPTTQDGKTDEGAVTATGGFTSGITGLSAGTTYYVKAYAANAGWTAYGKEISFTTLPAPSNPGSGGSTPTNQGGGGSVPSTPGQTPDPTDPPDPVDPADPGSVTGNLDNTGGSLGDSVIQDGAKVSGGAVAGEIIVEDGILADVEIKAGATVIGGSLSGEIKNSGSLTDVAILPGGSVEGGSLGGFIDNSGTIKGDIALAPGTTIEGGIVKGSITGGNGTAISNALIDADTLTGVTLGQGCTITKNSAQGNPGLDLMDIVTDSSGAVWTDLPLVADGSATGKSANTLMADAAAGLLGGPTVVAANGDGHVTIEGEAMGDALVPASLVSLETTDLPDAVTLTPTGELHIIENGIAMTLAPAAADLNGFNDALAGSGITGEVKSDGRVFAQLPGGITLALRFDNIAKIGGTFQGTSQEAGFTMTGDPALPGTLMIRVTYPDGTVQKLPPSIHHLNGFRKAMDAEPDLTYTIDPGTGIITLFGTDGGVAWRGIPGYELLDPPGFFVGMLFEPAGDVNNDGRDDVYIVTYLGRQVVYTLN